MAKTNSTSCNLFIPHIYYLRDLELDGDGKITRASIDRVAEMAADNLKAIELWANKIGPMICDCDCGGGANEPPAGPRCWYRGETLTSGGSNGDPIAFWHDISGNDFDMLQADSSKQPTLLTGALNGKAIVDFDGSNDIMHNAEAVSLMTAAGVWTVFAVFNPDSVSGQLMVFNGDDQTNQPGKQRQSQFLMLNGGEISSEPEAATVVSSGVGIGTSAWYIGESVRTTTDVTVWSNGVTLDGPTLFPAADESANGWYIAGHPAGSAFLDGKIAEIIGYDRILSSAERAQMYNYLDFEYGLLVTP